MSKRDGTELDQWKMVHNQVTRGFEKKNYVDGNTLQHDK
jgi:hypothetical protein